MKGRVALCVSLVALVALVQVIELRDRMQRTELGEDADFDVKTWSKQHRVNVGDGHLDRASVKSIWSSPNKAWKGIDSILPTGGRYGYEEDHSHTADQAKMLHFLEGAKKQVARMRAAMPKGAPTKEAREAEAVLDGEEKAISSAEIQVSGVHSAADAQKGGAQMLAQQKSQGRVFIDNALYGEGIEGDIESRGHHTARWNAHGAAADMKSYFNKLRMATDGREAADRSRHPGVKPWGGNDKGMHGYWKKLAHRIESQDETHKDILAKDGYFHDHPFEHANKHEWIRNSWNPAAKSSNKVQADVGSKSAREWQAKHGIPKTAADLAAFAKFEARALAGK